MPERQGYNPEIQDMRDHAASEIKDIRKERDEARLESKKIRTRIREALDFSGKEKSASKADRLHRKARTELEYQSNHVKNVEKMSESQRKGLRRKEIYEATEVFDIPIGDNEIQVMNLDLLKARLELFKEGLGDKKSIQTIVTRANFYLESASASDYQNEEFTHTTVDFLTDNIETLKTLAKVDNPYDGLRALKNVVWRGTDRQKELAKKVLVEFSSAALEKIDYGTFHGIISQIYEASEKDNREIIEKKIRTLINVNSYQGSHLLQEMILDGHSPDSSSKAKEILSEILVKLELDPEKCLNSWLQSTRERRLTIARNLSELFKLEEESPTAAAYLAKEFGVLDFARYPRELLKDQFDQRNDKSKPYGIVIFPRADHNGAFYHDTHVFGNVVKQLGDRYYLRVAEAETKIDVVRRLSTFKKNYGPATFAFIGGHGEPDLIQFGSLGGEGRYGLRSEDLIGRGSERSRQFFVDNPTIILVSCSTGTKKGIGQKLSERLAATIIAPETPTSMSKVDISFSNNRPVFKVSYRDSSEKQYEKGIKI